MASGIIGNDVPRKGLRVRVPCPPLLWAGFLETLWVYFETQRHREAVSEKCGFWTALCAVKFLMEAEWRESSAGSACAAPLVLPGRLRNSACIEAEWREPSGGSACATPLELPGRLMFAMKAICRICCWRLC